MDRNPTSSRKPYLLITGSGGFIGSALVNHLAGQYHVIGLDRSANESNEHYTSLSCDLTDENSIQQALDEAAERTDHFAAVIHLAAYFDFSGEEHPLYQKLNVKGTRLLIRQLQRFEVERFIYASTILVHRGGEPGVPIDEDSPLEPRWAYPISKLAAEQAIEQECGDMPYAILRLAGLYTEDCQSPMLAHQIDRIYQDKITGHVYAGDPDRGQSALHIEDMLSALAACIEARNRLPNHFVALIGEPLVSTYSALQNRIGDELHDEPVHTLSVPKPLAKIGAWAQEKAEPLIPDAIDQGQKPFIRPFMIDLSEDHYELNIARAREALGWEPHHSLRDELPHLIARFKEDPKRWYRVNNMTPPNWLQEATEAAESPDQVQERLDRLEEHLEHEHQQWLWAYAVSAVLGVWLITSPPTLGYADTPMAISDVLSGALILVFALLSLSRYLAWARWGAAAVGLWAAFAPLVFWTPSAAAYLNGTLVGFAVAGLSTIARPTPGIDPAARLHRAAVPPGWSYAPSTWPQRLPIILLAVVGLLLSRYMAAYQLGHIPAVWDPFFGDGTERIITSEVSEAWPVPDAGLGGLVYLAEILAGSIGSRYRWHQMPWLTLLFGFLIVPLGAVSIYFIIIQPIVIGTWCTACLIAAAAMVFQIPYSIDEIVATGQLLVKRARRGEPWLRILLFGTPMDRESAESPLTRERLTTDQPRRAADVSAPWTLCVSALIGVLLMFSRLTVGAEPGLAHADHLIGALVITVSVASFAQSARPLRFVNGVLGVALIAAPFLFSGGNLAAGILDVVLGLALIALCIPRGRISSRYGSWDRYLI
ncbi:NAD-dependent epimerase/dehydratase family protein [Gilvimarinus sp. F26214L]|uniref:NAD-dependent epimerase/dehydratase family protein n=1 Tax=Gilvimarinus sp. DZF01 TaxID=3461371 RepID=UPI004045A3D3